MSKPVVEKSHLYRQYYDMMIWSTFAYVMASLFLNFLYTLQTTFLHLIIGVKFQYRPFGIIYLTDSKGQWGNWSESKIMVIYGIGVIVFFILGRLTLKLGDILKFGNIIVRLFVVWFSFFAMHMFVMGMLSGVYFFDDFGIAYTWLFPEKWLRLTFAIVAFAFCIYMRPWWLKQFLRLSFTQDAVKDLPSKRDYILRIFIMPYVFGSVILMPYVLSGMYKTWMVMLLGFSLIVLPIVNPFFPKGRPMLVKTVVPAIASRNTVYRLVLLLAVLLLGAFFRVNI
jgi:hypothetical protein